MRARKGAETRVRVSDASLVDDLLEFLGRVPDCLVERVDDDEIEVSIVSSMRAERLREQLEDYLAEWNAARPGARAEIVREDG